MAVFVDLNVTNCTDIKKLQSIIEMAAHLGYSAIAINHVAEFEKKKPEIAKPISTKDLFPSPPTVQGKATPIKILTRLTIIASDPSHCNALTAWNPAAQYMAITRTMMENKTAIYTSFVCKYIIIAARATSAVTRLYDIVAVYPKTEKLFHTACTNIDVDIICINVTEKYPFFFRRPPINAAIERGIFFELIYTPAIRDSSLRRYTISNAISLMEVCKGKNIIVSSGAEKPLDLRGPYDIATLGLLFGLSERSAKAALSTNCRAALLHGETRKTAFGITYTVKKPEVVEEESAEPAFKKAKKE